MDNNMIDSSSDTGKHGVEAGTLRGKVNIVIALLMLALALVSGIMDIKTGNIGWATVMFICVAWWIYVCIIEFIRYKSRKHETSS